MTRAGQRHAAERRARNWLDDRIRISVRTMRLLGREIDVDVVRRATGLDVHHDQAADRKLIETQAEGPL